MIYVPIVIMWFTVSFFIINCVNKDDARNSWDDEPVYKKMFFVVIIPVMYLFLGAYEAFKK